MQHRVGVVGLGLMGQRMLQMLARHEAFTVTCLHDSHATQARSVAASHAPARVVDQCAAVCTADDVDVVYIATPPATHVAIARQALSGGKAIFCEKPLAVDIAEAEQLVSEVRDAGVADAIHFPFAAAAGLTRIESELTAGDAGAATRVDIVHHFSSWPRSWHVAGEWLAGSAEGGFVREVFSHFAYLTQRVLGPLRVERAHLQPRALATADSAAAPESAVVAELLAGSTPVRFIAGVGGAAPDSNEWTLYATERSYRLRDWGQLVIGTHAGWSDAPWEAPQQEFPGQATLDALAARLRGEPSVLPRLAEGLQVQRTVEALLALR